MLSSAARIVTILHALIIAADAGGIALLLVWAAGSLAIFYTFTVQSNVLLGAFATWQLWRR